ncbi:MAG: MFS transporter, partial [Candidatus Omnitrophota bacterium]|nr:MFS transporter [Candidatus Omnitrophota bacterium]
MNQRSAQRGFTALLVTQFFGAFNDNIFKFVVSVIAVDYLSTAYLSASSVVFVLPFLLFSTYAGYLADRFSKKTIIVVVRAFELVVMTMALIAFLRQDVGLMFVVLFCKGAQSAVFSPSKYGILPEILEPRRLSEGNGMLVLWTWVAIILGEALGGPLMKLIAPNFHLAAYCFLAIAVLGLGASLFIPSVEPVRSQRPWKWNFLGEIWANLKWIRKDRAIFLSMIGLAYFNVLAGLFHLNILVYTRQLMGTGYFETGALMACLAIGIGLGSVAAGKLSDRKIELGLVPLGAAGLSVFCFSLGGAYHSFPAVVVCLFLLGTFCGFYIVPLNALIQQKSPHQQRGQVLGTNNFLCFVGLLLGSALLYLLSKVLGLNAAQIFVVTGAITLAGVVYITSLLPYAFVRFLVWLLAHTVYKIKAVNPQHVPDKGGALLVCNHVSLVDWLMLIVTIQRPIRFVMGRHVYESKPLHPLYKLIRAIPISHDDNPKEIVRSLQRAREIIKNGELVCIFAEGQITRTGNILKFNKGLEHIIKGTGCPIIPVHLDRIWGSIFSFEGGKFIHKMPKILPYPVTVSYGPPLPSDADAFEVRNRVLELGAEAFRYRLADRIPLPVAFWREARRHPFQFCIADSAGQRMNYALTMISAVALARRIKKNQAGEEKIGILLPPSVGGALANLAVAIAKKVPVNLNYTTSKDALASIVEQCRMKTVITSKTFLEKTGLSFSCKTVLIEDIVKSVQPVEKLAAAVKFFAFPKFLSRRLIFGPRNGWTIDSLATIMFTSGSTGTPKGVLLTHANITSNLEGLYEVFHTKDDDVILGVLPFFHSFGFTATLWFPLVCG